jgi:hypothetical protein
MRHHDTAKGTGHEASSKNTEGLNLAHLVGHTDGEEQFADHGGKKDKDNEIIVLKRGAK